MKRNTVLSFMRFEKPNLIVCKIELLMKFSNNAAFKRIILIHTYCTLFIKFLKPTTCSPNLAFAFALSDGA